jgi:hypothetical protein
MRHYFSNSSDFGLVLQVARICQFDFASICHPAFLAFASVLFRGCGIPKTHQPSSAGYSLALEF